MSEVEESVFQIVQRLVKPIATIAEMMRVGDADQVRLYGLSKMFLSQLTDLSQDFGQSIAQADNSEETKDRIVAEIAQIIFSLKDYLMAAANEREIRVRELIQALYDGIPRR